MLTYAGGNDVGPADRDVEERDDGGVEERAGTQLTCFTGTKVHGTKVQILTRRTRSHPSICIGSWIARSLSTRVSAATLHT